MPPRLTFTSAIVASVHCPSAALRHPGFACFQSTLEGTGTPSLVQHGVTRGSRERKRLDRIRTNADVNEHQRIVENLGFSTRNPRKAGQDDSATRRQDVANEHQFLVENLWLFNQKPKESRAGCPGFPYR